MTGKPRSVDKLVLQILVDNTVEWLSPLPPGFTSELRQHIHGQNEVEPDTGVPILNFNKFCCGAHGLAILIETQVEGEPPDTILFDTGPDSSTLIRNSENLDISFNKIDRIVLSHWHSDHSGGILSFLEHRRSTYPNSTPPCIIDVHPDRPDLRGMAPGPTFEKVMCALPEDPSFDAVTLAGGIIEKHAEEHTIANNTVWVSGEIPRVTHFEAGIKGGARLANRKWMPEEDIMDERYVAVDVAGKGLVLFSSCSHAGIVNVVKDAIQKLCRPVYMVLGGLHLAGAEYAPRIPLTVDFLASQLKPSPTYIVPLHCTGLQARIALEAAFGEGCVPGGTGNKIDIIGDRDMDILQCIRGIK